MRQNFTFSVSQPKPTSEVLRFYEGEKGEKGIEIDQCLFTDALFRNKTYFQATHLLRVKNKLSSIMYNFNHDLSETGGKYLGNKTQLVNIWSEYNDGVFEIWGTMRSTDPVVVARKDEITGPSVECTVETETLIKNDLGLYAPEIDFYAIALLTGVVAGSQGTRNGEIRDFEFSLNNLLNNNNMQEQQIKELLEAQKKELTLEFSDKLDKAILEFSEKTLGTSQTQSKGTCSWVGSDGKTYTDSWESIYRSMTTVMESENETEIMDFKNKFGLPEDFKFKAEPDNQENKPNPEDEKTLTNIENNLNQANSLKNSMKNSKEDKVNSDSVTPPAKITYSSFRNELAKTIQSNFSTL